MDGVPVRVHRSAAGPKFFLHLCGVPGAGGASGVSRRGACAFAYSKTGCMFYLPLEGAALKPTKNSTKTSWSAQRMCCYALHERRNILFCAKNVLLCAA